VTIGPLAIKKVENETLPYKKFKRHAKPYWNDNLTSLRDSMRTHRINSPFFNALQIEGFFLRLFIIDHTDF
jgi:hypothetical protein